MPNSINSKIALVASLGLVSAFGSIVLISHWWRGQNQTNFVTTPTTSFGNELFSPVTAKASPSLDESRASFQLAARLIDQNQGQSALQKLQNLEQDYPLLAPYILLKQAKAQELAQETSQAQESLLKLVNSYPDSPATAEALYLLGKNNSDYWQQAIAKFPYHPRTHQIIHQLLEANPNQTKLMIVLVKYTPDAQGVDQIRERLVKEYADSLTPSDWQTIADHYWQKWDYGKAGKAYAKASVTSQNLYRAGRGYHLGGDKITAQKYYQQLIQQFPDTEDTAWGLRRLATIVDKQQAISYLDTVINKFPTQAGDALVEKAKILDSLNSNASAQQTRQLLLTKYTNSDAAAEYRWQIAQQYAQKNDLVAAWQWAQQIAINNPKHSLAPKASFWIAKWATKLGRSEDAKTAFESVLMRYPQSYYAWRSAVALGWNVGDFDTVRQLEPQVTKLSSNFVPTAGSEVFQELYQLGLKTEAWNQFRADLLNQEKLSVAEEFTYGLMELDQGKNLRGINRISELKEQEQPENQAEWQKLQQTPAYWQALYPFPFEDKILKWSEVRKLNPLLVTALIRQESRFEPEIESSAGALGLMQVMPETGKYVAQQIDLPNYSLTNPEHNINLGTFYLDYTHRKYNNNSMLAVASYNAGPNAVAKWVSRYGLEDPDEFVEQIPYQETKGYVESVFENYWNYMLIYNPEIAQLYQQISKS
ncbi:Lytic transglycosylase catalytic [Stanieria cyanosphaera PCC 7437]|uniref:Lytic transglycosylase catalytic n=1 Tax=Stanieria cyanosphaera (strain ATCC 29371 / PCC 7437) TaxID=111780 RepID=K9XUN5_STAC7|nr:transglycosylase SLT domain-containing protein [Stanieria cyanosphaera]AFZ35791.1 Lytic transglycosylase catalytic [Stanieria cyanosphaera PCC 7437]